jgi:hypothetical protein
MSRFIREKGRFIRGKYTTKEELLSQQRNYGKDCPTQFQGFTLTPGQLSGSPKDIAIHNLVWAAQVLSFKNKS